MQFFVNILQDVKPDSGWDTDTTTPSPNDDLDKASNKTDNFNK